MNTKTKLLSVNEGYGGDIGVRKKGIWSRFINLIRTTKIPWVLVVVTVVVGLISSKLSSIFPDYQQKITGGDFSTKTIGIGIGILFVSTVVGMISTYLQGYTRSKINKRVFDTVWSKVLTLPISIYQSISPRELISRTTSDTTYLGTVFVTIITSILTNLFTLYLSFKYIYGYNKILFYIQVSMIPIFVIVKFVQGGITFKYSYNQQKKLADLTKYLSQILINIPLVKVFVKEKEEKENGEKAIRMYNKARYKLNVLDTVFSAIDNMIVNINTVIAVIVGAYFISTKQITVGIWIAYYMYSQNISTSIMAITQIWPLLKNSQGCIERVCDFMEVEGEVYDGIDVSNEGEDIIVKDLSFSYNSKQIFNNINIKIPDGSYTAIVGGSGSGKTTLLSLIERFYEADDGDIMYGKTSIKEINLTQWRRNISYLSQEISLFRGSILENLCYGLGYKPTYDEVIEATKKVDIYDKIISLEFGFDTIVSEGGVDLSGGERQRLALARLLLKRSNIILLDEATSNLDAKSEQIILDALEKLCIGKTTIAVAHRIKTVEKADQIIVLDKGVVSAVGSHDVLLEISPLYKKIVESEFIEEV